MKRALSGTACACADATMAPPTTPAPGLWLPIVYGESYDDHEVDHCGLPSNTIEGDPRAQCRVVARGTSDDDKDNPRIELRGTIQCHKGAHGCFLAANGAQPPRLGVLPLPCRPTKNVHLATSSWEKIWGNAREPDLPDAFEVGEDGGLSLSGGAHYNMWCLKLDGLPPYCRDGSYCTPLALRVTVTIVDVAAACTLLYLLMSVAVNAIVFHKRGWRLIPHADHVRTLAGLVYDGVLFSSTIVRCQSQSAVVTARPSLQSDGPTTVLLTQQPTTAAFSASCGRRRMVGKPGWQASAGVSTSESHCTLYIVPTLGRD